MKKQMILVPLMVLTLLLFAGCGNKPAQNEAAAPPQTNGSQQPASSGADSMPDLSAVPAELQQAVSNALAGVKAGNITQPDNWNTMTDAERTDWAMQMVMNSAWPFERLPEGTPEYTGGKIINTGGPDGNFMILVEGTEEDIDAYLSELEGAGYALDTSNNAAKKGGTTITIDDRGNGTWQMGVVTFATADWPNTIPAFILRPDGKALIGEPYLDDMGSLVNLTLDVNDMSEDEGKAWLDEMTAAWDDSYSGSDGSGQWVGTVEHEGKSWQVVAEIYEASGGVFTATFSWSEQ